MVVSSRPVWATQQDPLKKRKEERGERGKGGIKCFTTSRSSLNKCGSLASNSNLGPKMSHLKKALSTLTPTLPYRACVNLQLSTQHWTRENQQWGSALLLDKYMYLNKGFTIPVSWSPILKTEIRIRLVLLSSGLEKRQNELSTQERRTYVLG